jgi:hypothetical protein
MATRPILRTLSSSSLGLASPARSRPREGVQPTPSIRAAPATLEPRARRPRGRFTHGAGVRRPPLGEPARLVLRPPRPLEQPGPRPPTSHGTGGARHRRPSSFSRRRMRALSRNRGSTASSATSATTTTTTTTTITTINACRHPFPPLLKRLPQRMLPARRGDKRLRDDLRPDAQALAGRKLCGAVRQRQHDARRSPIGRAYEE